MAAIVVGARVRCVGGTTSNGPGASGTGTVRRTTPCYAFVDFGGPRLQKKIKLSLQVDGDPRAVDAGSTETAAALPTPTLAPTHYFVGWVLEGGGLPFDVEEKIMAFLHDDHAACVFPVAHSCRRWRDAVVSSAWNRLDLTANGPNLSRWYTEQFGRRNQAVDLSRDFNLVLENAPKHYCEWMLRAANEDTSLVAKLVSFRASTQSREYQQTFDPLHAQIVASAVNLQEFSGSRGLAAKIEGKPIRVCKGISNLVTLASFACSLHDLEFTWSHWNDSSVRTVAIGATVCTMLNRLLHLRRLCMHMPYQRQGDRTGMKLRLQHLQSIHIHGKSGPSIDFGSELPNLIEYHETGHYGESAESSIYLGEVLAACCPMIDLTQYECHCNSSSMRDGRGVWGGQGALDVAVAEAQADWDRRHHDGQGTWDRRPNDHIPFVSDAVRSDLMRTWEERRPRRDEREPSSGASYGQQPCGARVMRGEAPWTNG